ncbi:hypothetical protein E2557_00005, partial [Staphylococcus petrasii]
ALNLFAFQCKMYLGHVKVLLGMFLSLKTLYRKRTVIWPFYFLHNYTDFITYTTLCTNIFNGNFFKLLFF